MTTPDWSVLARLLLAKRDATTVAEPVQMPFRGYGPLATALGFPRQRLETTSVPTHLQKRFQKWLRDNEVTDYGNPESRYDYGGAFLAGLQREDGGHFVDRFKQFGHPSFSDESVYAQGQSAPTWFGDILMKPFPLPQATDATKVNKK
jgi:hypothetical protein